MRRLFTVLACAVIVVTPGAPVWANDKPQSGDQPITAMGNRDGRRGDYRHGGRHRHHDGHRHGYRRYRDYDDDYYYGRGGRYRRGGYYGGGYYGGGRGYYDDRYYGGGRGYYDDRYYGGGRGYYGDRYYYDRYNYDRYDNCGYGGARYDYRCDCYHRDTRCDRSGYRGRGYYGPYSVDGQPVTSPAPDAPAAESPSPQAEAVPAAYEPQHAESGPKPDAKATPPPAAKPAPAPDAAPSPEATLLRPRPRRTRPPRLRPPSRSPSPRSGAVRRRARRCRRTRAPSLPPSGAHAALSPGNKKPLTPEGAARSMLQVFSSPPPIAPVRGISRGDCVPICHSVRN